MVPSADHATSVQVLPDGRSETAAPWAAKQRHLCQRLPKLVRQQIGPTDTVGVAHPPGWLWQSPWWCLSAPVGSLPAILIALPSDRAGPQGHAPANPRSPLSQHARVHRSPRFGAHRPANQGDVPYDNRFLLQQPARAAPARSQAPGQTFSELTVRYSVAMPSSSFGDTVEGG